VSSPEALAAAPPPRDLLGLTAQRRSDMGAMSDELRGMARVPAAMVMARSDEDEAEGGREVKGITPHEGQSVGMRADEASMHGGGDVLRGGKRHAQHRGVASTAPVADHRHSDAGVVAKEGTSDHSFDTMGGDEEEKEEEEGKGKEEREEEGDEARAVRKSAVAEQIVAEEEEEDAHTHEGGEGTLPMHYDHHTTTRSSPEVRASALSHHTDHRHAQPHLGTDGVPAHGDSSTVRAQGTPAAPGELGHTTTDTVVTLAASACGSTPLSPPLRYTLLGSHEVWFRCICGVLEGGRF
jgi:hypothetical protein